jgi:short-subunit dehydrogenase
MLCLKRMVHDRLLYTYKTNILVMFDLTRYVIPNMTRCSSIINTASVVVSVDSFSLKISYIFY